MTKKEYRELKADSEIISKLDKFDELKRIKKASLTIEDLNARVESLTEVRSILEDRLCEKMKKEIYWRAIAIFSLSGFASALVAIAIFALITRN